MKNLFSLRDCFKRWPEKLIVQSRGIKDADKLWFYALQEMSRTSSMFTPSLQEKSAKSPPMFLWHWVWGWKGGWGWSWTTLMILGIEGWFWKGTWFSVRWAYVWVESIYPSCSVCCRGNKVFYFSLFQVLWAKHALTVCKNTCTWLIFQSSLTCLLSIVRGGAKQFCWRTQWIQLLAKKKYGLLARCELLCCCCNLPFLLSNTYETDGKGKKNLLTENV